MARKRRRVLLLHGAEAVDPVDCLLAHPLAPCRNLVPLIHLAGLEEALDDGQHDLELSVVRQVWVW